MIFAAIDIGSNAGRLLVANLYEKKGNPLTEKISLVRVPLRLGMDVFDQGYITPQKVEMLLKTLDTYQKLIKVYKPVSVAACGTAAMREAKNTTEVVERIKEKTGLDLIVLTGMQEALVVSSSDNQNVEKKHRYSLYVDVGGGSTEFSFFDGRQVIESCSFNIGTIRMLLDKVGKREWEEVKLWIQQMVLSVNEPINFICSGGNINKLTKLFGNIEHNTLTYTQLSDGYAYLEGFPVEDRIANMGLRPDRADVIVPAAIIFKNIMKWANLTELQAPKIGLADGLIIELYKKQNNLPTIVL